MPVEKYCPSDSYIIDSDDENAQYGELNELQTAARDGDFDKVKQIVENYSTSNDNTLYDYINQNSYRRFNALDLAARKDHWDIVKYLVQKGAKLNNFTTKRVHLNALLYAILSDNLDMVKFLMENYKDEVNLNDLYDANYNTPLCLCVRNSKWDMLYYLIENGGADVNRLSGPRQDDTVLSYALTLGKVDIIPTLVSKYNAKFPTNIDKREVLYKLITVSDNLLESIKIALNIPNPDDASKPFYTAESICMAIYGLLRNRAGLDGERLEVLNLLLSYDKQYQLNTINTPILFESSYITLLVGFRGTARIPAIFDNNPDQAKKFTLYDLAVIAKKQDYIDALAAVATPDTVQNAQQYQ